MKKITLVFALLAVALSAAASAAVNNGSFETPVFTSMAAPFIGAGATVSANGWNWFGGSGGIYGENHTIYPYQYGNPAPDGLQWIEWANNAYIYQNLGPVAAGWSYQLSFSVGQDTSASTGGNTTGSLQLTNGINTVTLASVQDNAPVARTWKQFQTGMAPIAAQYNNWNLVVRVAHSSSHWEGLDNVRVTGVLLPEPGSLIALGSGLIGLIGTMIRKRG